MLAAFCARTSNLFTIASVIQEDEKKEDVSADSETFTGDGTVDRKGNIAQRRKTGGWRAAPLIFGVFINNLEIHRVSSDIP